MRNEEKSGKRRGAVLCCLCFFLAACLVVCASAAYARYVSSGEYDMEAGVDGLSVTSTITYTDAAGKSAEAFGGSLGAMKSGSDGIFMTLKVTNESVFAVSCHVTISDGYSFTSCTSGNAAIADDTLTLNDAVAAGDTATVLFVVKVDEDYWAGKSYDSGSYNPDEALFRYMELTVNYEQAG